MSRLTCKMAIEFLDDYVDGSLPPEVRADFDAHLAQCPHCVDYLRTYRDTIALSRRACASDAADGGASIDVPDELVAAVLRALKRDQ